MCAYADVSRFENILKLRDSKYLLYLLSYDVNNK